MEAASCWQKRGFSSVHYRWEAKRGNAVSTMGSPALAQHKQTCMTAAPVHMGKPAGSGAHPMHGDHLLAWTEARLECRATRGRMAGLPEAGGCRRAEMRRHLPPQKLKKEREPYISISQAVEIENTIRKTYTLLLPGGISLHLLVYERVLKTVCMTSQTLKVHPGKKGSWHGAT